MSSSEPISSHAPPSSGLSDPPHTNAAEAHTGSEPSANAGTMMPPFQTPQVSASTEEIVKRVTANAGNVAAGTPGWEVAKAQLVKDMATSDKFPTDTPPRDASAPKRGNRGGRGGKRGNLAAKGAANGDESQTTAGGSAQLPTPGSTGRGRGGGRPRGRGRGRGGGRGGKRKREDDDDGDSDSSEEVLIPMTTMTKSGRSIQKPTAFVPPPPASPTTHKRRRTYRRNPESAVCKICLRGTSPASNMIVFCDGCNTAYHRYCHHPPIDQSVIDDVDKEWFCKSCEKERLMLVPESEIASFVSADGVSVEEVSGDVKTCSNSTDT